MVSRDIAASRYAAAPVPKATAIATGTIMFADAVLDVASDSTMAAAVNIAGAGVGTRSGAGAAGADRCSR